jgi:hypothetical protein
VNAEESEAKFAWIGTGVQEDVTPFYTAFQNSGKNWGRNLTRCCENEGEREGERDRGSKMVLNYRMMVERYPNLKEGVGGSNPGCEISSLLDGKLARWLTTSYALEMACRPSVSKKNKVKKKEEKGKRFTRLYAGVMRCLHLLLIRYVSPLEVFVK